MVSQKEKKQAAKFICERIEDSELFVVQRVLPESITVTEKPEVREEPRTICTVIANFFQPIEEFGNQFRKNQYNNIYTAPVFYKDGKTAFFRMVERSAWREDKSLKRYTPQQINEMIALRGIEKAVLDSWGTELAYYQPETARLEESLREFDLKTVHLDYSHLTPSDPGYDFAENRDSINYKLPRETDKIFSAVRFGFYNGGKDSLKRAIIFPADNRRIMRERTQIAEAELRENAQDYFPGLDPEEAKEALSPEE